MTTKELLAQKIPDTDITVKDIVEALQSVLGSDDYHDLIANTGIPEKEAIRIIDINNEMILILEKI